MIIDGQQRLTSLLLAYLGIFPDAEKYKQKQEENIYTSNKEGIDTEEDSEEDNMLEWQFKLLTEKGKNKDEILKEIESKEKDNYVILPNQINNEFLESRFLGFSYLVPNIGTDYKAQQKYYAAVFKNINMGGVALSPLESRAALYFLSPNIEPTFFDPEFIKRFKIKTTNSTPKLDFVRYLSVLSQYKKVSLKSQLVFRKYSGKNKDEEYYSKYIYSVVEDDTKSSMFTNFQEIFPKNAYRDDFSKLEKAIAEIDIPKEFTSIIDADIYFFGLIYFILFEKKEFPMEKKDELKEKIALKIKSLKKDSLHKSNPNALKYMRIRLDSSISIYKKYIQ